MILISSDIVLNNGVTPLSPLLISVFAWSWCNFEFYPQMNMFLEAGLEMEKTRYRNEHELASCTFIKLMSYYFSPTINPLEVWNISEEAFLLSVKSKNKHYGGFSILWYPFHHLFYSHGDVKTSIGLSLNSIEILKRNGNVMLMDASKMILELKYVLSGDVDHFQPTYVSQVKEYPSYRQMHYSFKGISLYFQNEIEKSFKCMEKSYDFREDSVGMCSSWIDLIFLGLISAIFLRSAQEKIEKAQEILKYSIERLEMISQVNSSVFLAPLELIRAETLYSEYCRTGVENTRKIISHYRKSYVMAEKERNTFLARLINLRTGEFYNSLGMDDGISGNYFLRAMESFEQFGASIVVDYILENYSGHIDGYSSFSNRNPEQVFSNTSLSDESTDHTLAGVTKSRISESTELDFREIFISILPILSEQTLSPRCCLILKRDSTVYVDAEFNAGMNSIEALSSIKQFENSDLDKFSDSFPLKMIHRTLRSRTEQQLVWNDNEKEYYFVKNVVASALSIPIMKKKTVIGCIYLENKETKDVFTTEKINLAKLIISISLDNAGIFTSINKSYARFLPAEFLKLLGKSHVTKIRLGDAISREMTVLFSDIYGFTEIMEGLSAKDGFAFINLLLKSIAPPISRNSGFIDKFVGDGILALFIEPQGAVTAALEMISELEVFNTRNNTNVKLGIGLHHGIVQLGTIGYEQRLDATVISDTVNTASRCESLTRTFHSHILVTKPVMDVVTVPHSVISTVLGKFMLKGKHIPHQIYNIASKSWKGSGTAKEFTLLSKVIDLFSRSEFTESFALAETILKNTKNNTIIAACNMYKEASTLYASVVLPSEWQGEIRLTKDGEVREYFQDK
ncbi:soluble adenylate/guanylate cyclase [Naegleria gruberi]|uniref:Soluble adenylate/guanylate cyclase n=1 Tax=Naegleria gruberi TaxID=5762 RepID=D2V9T5_NAEGR|nr:soluble adenylate/guanylate cyclase [Naegleria gruberi]EFC46195.1 soluble adenylate/guanylate cyclase [Naegleria gruberi]|eukprot:XP_002678939.1 soluble adenylate/guanylate cyclase [Naegleria gruberi strain NEG-M]